MEGSDDVHVHKFSISMGGKTLFKDCPLSLAHGRRYGPIGPNGCGKSTLTGLYCAWRLALDNNLRILVLSADEALAGKMVRNIRRVIERHPLTADLMPVGSRDQWANDRFTIRRELEKARPDWGFLLEEGGEVAGKDPEAPVWIVDPLDGTTNFLHGIPQFAISVGYVQVRFGSSYFDVQLLNRGVDISDGRTGLFNACGKATTKSQEVRARLSGYRKFHEECG